MFIGQAPLQGSSKPSSPSLLYLKSSCDPQAAPATVVPEATPVLSLSPSANEGNNTSHAGRADDALLLAQRHGSASGAPPTASSPHHSGSASSPPQQASPRPSFQAMMLPGGRRSPNTGFSAAWWDDWAPESMCVCVRGRGGVRGGGQGTLALHGQARVGAGGGEGDAPCQLRECRRCTQTKGPFPIPSPPPVPQLTTPGTGACLPGTHAYLLLAGRIPGARVPAWERNSPSPHTMHTSVREQAYAPHFSMGAPLPLHAPWRLAPHPPTL